MKEIIEIVTTADERGVIQRIGEELVEKKLVACAQIVGPIRSIYRWKGKVEQTDEWLLLMKSKSSLYPVIEDEIKRLHPYEVPEIIAIGLSRGLPEYMNWVAEETI
ncbi:MAG TPA: divalent-cation tolerance protein CutA [Syntrophorhabdaceae bacterium]|nr:divalent-cation tolerance protein CutA [Syntrophorhabdaceae bacterium]